MTEILGGGTMIQLEGLNSCCIAAIQSLTSVSLKHEERMMGMVNPAEGQIICCPDCLTTIVYKAAAWRAKEYMSETHHEAD